MHTSRLAALLTLAAPLLPQVPQARMAPAPAGVRPETPRLPMAALPDLAKAVLLPPGKTQGTFHLNAFVRNDKRVVLRWANTHGEMPSEGVTVWRQKVGDRDWKELNRKDPVGFFKGPQVKARMKKLSDEAKGSLLSLFHSDLQRDPATKLRLKGKPAGSETRLKDVTPEKANAQYRALRTSGRLAKHDLQLLQARADADPAAADLFGLGFTDEPGKGRWKYKIVVKLAEGGTAEALCAKEIDPSVPTPVPAALNLSAKSGNGAVLLNWEAPPSDVVTGYHVYRAEMEKGPWKRVTGSAVKLVRLELEDPEAAMRRTAATNTALEKELRKASGQALTPGKIAELRTSAQERVAATGAPALSPALSASIKEGVASGRLKAAGFITPTSVYTDDRRKAGNGDLVNERPYLYRVTTVDITGGETGLESAPAVSGTPKDLEPPKVPGRPRLLAQAEALQRLQAAQNLRIKDVQLRELELAQAAKSPLQTQALTPALGSGASVIPSPTKPAPTAPAAYAGMSLGEVKGMRLARQLATAPSREMAEAAEAALLRSKPDGSVPPAKLTWTPSPDGDLATYEVYRAAGTGPFQKVATTAEAAWTDPGLEVGQAYRYVVSAVDKLGNESNRSDEGLVEVSDSRLKAKLALKGLKGQPSTAVLAPGTPGRSFLRPPGRVMKAAGLDFLKASAAPLKLPAGVVAGPSAPGASYKAPAAPKAAKAAAAPKGLAMAHGGALPKAMAAPVANPKTMTFAGTFKAVNVARVTLPNLMLVEPAHPKAIRVVLEWERPMEGRPLEYVVELAPQKFDVKQVPRPSVSVAAGLKFTTDVTGPKGAAWAGALAPGGTLPKASGTAAKMGVGGAAPSGPAIAPGLLVASTTEQHLSVSKGLVTTSDKGLKEVVSLKANMASLLVAAGPGAFTRVNEAPVGTERFVVTFPAEAAQYGGATFYFRVKAFTKEFGRTVEGPASEAVEVRLPDVVAPPIPAAGSIVLREGSGDQFDVAVDWTDVAAKDLAGYVLERQAMNYTLVDGLPKPGAPQGEAQKVVPDPLPGHAFQEKNAAGGYQRYTLRAVDKTGNRSEPSVPLDVFIPGEPVPGAPTGLALVGNRLTWKTGANALGYTVWRSFSGLEEDFEAISPILPASETGFTLPPQGTLHLRVVARSASGMHQMASEGIVRTP